MRSRENAIERTTARSCWKKAAGKQKGRREAGLFHREAWLGLRSVFRDDRAAPVIVHPNGAHIDVLTNIVAPGGQAAARRAEGDIAVAHEQMIVLNRHR